MTRPSLAPLPKGYNTINPFIITTDALKLIPFLEAVFGATEDMTSRTMDNDGLLLHAELVIGNARVLIADRKPDWPFTPSLLQIYVDDLEATLKRAEELGAKIATKPTDFYGDVFSRFVDPWNNVWWTYQHNPQADVNWSEDSSASEAWEPTEELQYIHATLLDMMKNLGSNPR